MSKCTKNASIYEDLEKCPGQKKLPGIRDHVYATSKRDILAYPSVPDSPKTLAEAVQTTGDFTLAADKYFYKIGIVKDNGKIEVENQGTDGCKTFLNKTTFAIPGTEEEASGFIEEDFSPELSLKQDTGAAATDSNTTTVEASATDFHPAPFYTGKIHTADGDIDGATCKLSAAAAEKPNP